MPWNKPPPLLLLWPWLSGWLGKRNENWGSNWHTSGVYSSSLFLAFIHSNCWLSLLILPPVTGCSPMLYLANHWSLHKWVIFSWGQIWLQPFTMDTQMGILFCPQPSGQSTSLTNNVLPCSPGSHLGGPTASVLPSDHRAPLCRKVFCILQKNGIIGVWVTHSIYSLFSSRHVPYSFLLPFWGSELLPWEISRREVSIVHIDSHTWETHGKLSKSPHPTSNGSTWRTCKFCNSMSMQPEHEMPTSNSIRCPVVLRVFLLECSWGEKEKLLHITPASSRCQLLSSSSSSHSPPYLDFRGEDSKLTRVRGSTWIQFSLKFENSSHFDFNVEL